jgi:hypothetical protein
LLWQYVGAAELRQVYATLGEQVTDEEVPPRARRWRRR